jgi:integrase
MPSVQRGQVKKLAGGSWAYRYRDARGQRHQVGGYKAKSEAIRALEATLQQVRMGAVGIPIEMTLQELVDDYLGQHVAEANTLRALSNRLRHATNAFGHVRVDRLQAREVGAWRRTLPPRSAWHIHAAFRQVLHYAVRIRVTTENVAVLVPNPQTKRGEVRFFLPDEVEAISAELGPGAHIPLFAAWTGLRPSEWIALERGDIDRDAGLLRIRRVYTDRQVKHYGKQDRSLRAVPLPERAAQALAELPARLDTRLLFPGVQGGYLDLSWWRENHWTPAVRAAGVEHGSPYALRHSYASWAIGAGVGLYELARIMGTSVKQIDKTYGHLLPDSIDRARVALNTFGHGLDTAAVGN